MSEIKVLSLSLFFIDLKQVCYSANITVKVNILSKCLLLDFMLLSSS